MNFSDDQTITEQFDPEELDNEEDSPSDFDKLFLEPPAVTQRLLHNSIEKNRITRSKQVVAGEDTS